MDLVLELNCFSFSNSNLNPNPTHVPKQQTPSPNHQFSQRFWYVEYYSAHAYMAWIQKFHQSKISLDTEPLPSGAAVETCIACLYRSQNIDKTVTLLRL